MGHSRASVVLVCLVVAATACSSGSGENGSGSSDTEPPTSPLATDTDEPSSTAAVSDTLATDSLASDPTTAAPPLTEPPDEADALDESSARARGVVTALASDELMGRDDLTEGSALAQEFLVAELADFTLPIGADDVDPQDGHRQDYGDGVNLIGIIPGSDLSEEYVLIGAHYDHLGNDCRNTTADDSICNGATDNATGVAAALEVARAVAAAEPRRTVVVALWDGEEDGLVGSARYVADPVVPLAQTIAYLNFDIQGSNLVPSLSRSTVMVGAETGGQQLIDAALAATVDSPLTTANFSLIFGQGRSDHANLAAAGVPSVFFTDASNGCYHTVKDDLDAVDFAKLDAQIADAAKLGLDLVATDTPPVFVADAPPTVYADAVELLELVAAAEPDFALIGPDGSQAAVEFLVTLQAIVDAGADSYDDTAIAAVLSGAVTFVDRLANSECRPVG